MLFQLLHIRKTIKDAKEAKNDPSGFATSQIQESALGMIVPPYIFAFILIAVFFIVGYVAGDGSGFFKVLFWIFFIPFLLVSYFVYVIRRSLLRLTAQGKKTASSDVIYTEVKEVRETEYVQKESQ